MEQKDLPAYQWRCRRLNMSGPWQRGHQYSLNVWGLCRETAFVARPLRRDVMAVICSGRIFLFNFMRLIYTQSTIHASYVSEMRQLISVLVAGMCTISVLAQLEQVTMGPTATPTTTPIPPTTTTVQDSTTMPIPAVCYVESSSSFCLLGVHNPSTSAVCKSQCDERSECVYYVTGLDYCVVSIYACTTGIGTLAGYTMYTKTACTTPTTTTPIVCLPGTVLYTPANSAIGPSCTVCPANTFSANSVCQSVATACAAGQYEVLAPSSSTDRSCVPGCYLRADATYCTNITTDITTCLATCTATPNCSVVLYVSTPGTCFLAITSCIFTVQNNPNPHPFYIKQACIVTNDPSTIAPTTTTTPSVSSPSPNTAAIIAGAVVGGVCLLIIGAVGVVTYRHRHRSLP